MVEEGDKECTRDIFFWGKGGGRGALEQVGAVKECHALVEGVGVFQVGEGILPIFDGEGERGCVLGENQFCSGI